MEKNFKQEKSNLIKVVLFGPESTGKTTLAKQLANHYNTKWVPEYAREFLQKKWDTEKDICSKSDLIAIVNGQIRLENNLSKNANKVLFCDTNLLETKVYSEIYFNGFVDENLHKAAIEHHYDLYLLTSIDVPWEKDDLRDKPNDRNKLFEAFEITLQKYHKPYKVLIGNKEKRFQQATTLIDNLLLKNNS